MALRFVLIWETNKYIMDCDNMENNDVEGRKELDILNKLVKDSQDTESHLIDAAKNINAVKKKNIRYLGIVGVDVDEDYRILFIKEVGDKLFKLPEIVVHGEISFEGIYDKYFENIVCIPVGDYITLDSEMEGVDGFDDNIIFNTFLDLHDGKDFNEILEGRIRVDTDKISDARFISMYDILSEFENKEKFLKQDVFEPTSLAGVFTFMLFIKDNSDDKSDTTENDDNEQHIIDAIEGMVEHDEIEVEDDEVKDELEEQKISIVNPQKVILYFNGVEGLEITLKGNSVGVKIDSKDN